MPRNPRCVMPGCAHHITSRGVDRTDLFEIKADRETYLNLVRSNLGDAGVRVLAWCAMTNHVHWVVVPEREDSLEILFRRAHGRYAQYYNARQGRTGHLWERRFYSCPVERQREEMVLRYVELNPVRAGMVGEPEGYRWSSAGVHVGGDEHEAIALLDWEDWRKRGGAAGWREMLLGEKAAETRAVRAATYAGRPFGSEAFVERAEQQFGRQWRKRGRPAGKRKVVREKVAEPTSTLAAG